MDNDISGDISNDDVNNLRSAIYAFEMKTMNTLQLINGGGVAVLVGFLPYTTINHTNKWLYSISIISFILGLVFSILLSAISPKFLAARFRENEGSDMKEQYKSYSRLRLVCLYGSLLLFITAISSSFSAWWL